MSLKAQLKVTEVSNKWCTLFDGSREGVKPRLKRGHSRAPQASREALCCTLFDRKIVEKNSILCSRAPEKESKHQGQALCCTLFEGKIVDHCQEGVQRQENDHKQVRNTSHRKSFGEPKAKPRELMVKEDKIISLWKVVIHK